MPRRPHEPHQEDRPARVKLHGTILALIQFENGRRVRARLHQLSISGGTVNLETPVDEGITVELMFHVGTTTVRTKAEMMFPLWATKGCLQPFRFSELADEQRARLESDLQALLVPSTAAAPEEACLDSEEPANR